MNPYEIENASSMARLRQFAEAMLESIDVSEHNLRIEKEIKEKGDADGNLHKQYRKPRYWIRNLMILAQITDDEEHSPWEQETFKITAGGAVEFGEDGAVSTVEDYKNMGGVLCL